MPLDILFVRTPQASGPVTSESDASRSPETCLRCRWGVVRKFYEPSPRKHWLTVYRGPYVVSKALRDSVVEETPLGNLAASCALEENASRRHVLT